MRAVNKVKDGRPHIVDMVKAGEIQLVFTTVDETRTAIADSRHIRQAALAHRVTYYTSMAGCEAAVEGMKHKDDLTCSRCRNCTPNCTKIARHAAPLEAVAPAENAPLAACFTFSPSRDLGHGHHSHSPRAAPRSSRQSCTG